MKATTSILASLVFFCIIQTGVSRSLIDDGLQHHLNKREGDTATTPPPTVEILAEIPARNSSILPPDFQGQVQERTLSPIDQIRIDNLIEEFKNEVNSLQNTVTE